MKFKRWSGDRFARLGDAIGDRWAGWILLFGGRAERHLCEEVAHRMQGRCINLAGELSLSQTAAFIEKCEVFISNDSGLMHIAAALSVPVVAIFGPTDHRRTAPYGERNTVVRLDLPCSPCYVFETRWFQCRNPYALECLRELSVDRVFGAIEKCMDSFPP